MKLSIDLLFKSAARCCGRQVVGIILSGMLDDGSAGLVAIKQAGGIAMVQDPNEATHPGMPSAALALLRARREPGRNGPSCFNEP